MSSTNPPTYPAPPYIYRRATRDLSAPTVGGVAAGLARHLAVPVLWVRVFFVVAAPLSGLGIALYGALWAAMPAGSAFDHTAPGLEGASRDGRRPGRRRRITDLGPVLVLGVIGIAAAFTVQGLFGVGFVLWPLFLAVVGLGLLWRQADEAQRARWFDQSGRLNPLQIVFGAGGWASYARVIAGGALLAAAVVAVGLNGSVAQARGVLLTAVLVLAGLALVVGPWVWRLATELSDERAERVRTQERADVAAHLHDSVLQTLALIQKNAADPGTVARLARSQERDLRSWLFDDERDGDTSLVAALRAVAAEVEDTHGVPVDVVTVGDADTDALAPLVAAAREALANAAVHADVPRIDLYAETADGVAEVFVRDRGRGFDPDAVAADRHGVRNSIVDRMARHGGSAVVRSAPGEGTEVRLRLRFAGDDNEGE